MVSKTRLIERTVAILGNSQTGRLEESAEQSQAESESHSRSSKDSSQNHETYRAWWSPILELQPHDPDQEQGTLCWPNNVRFRLPYPGIWLTAYRVTSNNPRLGVFLSGGKNNAQALLAGLWEDRDHILSLLPKGSVFRCDPEDGTYHLYLYRTTSEFIGDDQAREWISKVIHLYLDALRPVLLAMQAE